MCIINIRSAHYIEKKKKNSLQVLFGKIDLKNTLWLSARLIATKALANSASHTMSPCQRRPAVRLGLAVRKPLSTQVSVKPPA